jgi:hypothetical protein
MKMGMPSRTILHMTIHITTRMGPRMDPSMGRSTGRSIFGVDGVDGADGVATTTGTVTGTGMAVDTVGTVDTVVDMVVDTVVADTGEVAKTSALCRRRHRLAATACLTLPLFCESHG